jgi:2-polyprenyl-6-methoxyphenol hydroxylase-like FAD-dependent oxidoreductase
LFEDGTSQQADLLVGTDGIYSAGRRNGRAALRALSWRWRCHAARGTTPVAWDPAAAVDSVARSQ